MSNHSLAELDRLAEPLHARIITREALATIQRLAYEAGRLGLVGVIDDPPMPSPLNVDILAAAIHEVSCGGDAELGHQCPLLAKAIAAWYDTLSGGGQHK